MRNPLTKEMSRLVLSFLLGAGGTGVGVGVITQTELLDQFTQQEVKQITQQPAATQQQVMDQFLNEKEGNRLTAYRDGKGIWTICRGVTRIDGKPVQQGMKLSQASCDIVNSKEANQSLEWVRKNVSVPLTPIQQVGIASFCPYNLGADKCRYNKNGTKTQFWRYIEKGDWKNACRHIPDWIFDGGKDCRIRSNNCAGQVLRRDQEEYLCLLQLGETK